MDPPIKKQGRGIFPRKEPNDPLSPYVRDDEEQLPERPIVKCVRCEGSGWQDEAYGNKSRCERCGGSGVDPINMR